MYGCDGASDIEIMAIHEAAFVPPPTLPRIRLPFGTHSHGGDRQSDAPALDRALHKLRDDPVSLLTLAHTPESTEDVLSESEFAGYLVRERSLADRGSRLFSLMVLELDPGNCQGFDRLARRLHGRLRSTDLIGRLAGDRLGVLLTDTPLAGAEAVALGWTAP